MQPKAIASPLGGFGPFGRTEKGLRRKGRNQKTTRANKHISKKQMQEHISKQKQTATNIAKKCSTYGFSLGLQRGKHLNMNLLSFLQANLDYNLLELSSSNSLPSHQVCTRNIEDKKQVKHHKIIRREKHKKSKRHLYIVLACVLLRAPRFVTTLKLK